MKADVIAADCEWVLTPGEAVVDGNIVTAWRRPDYDVWMRAFVSLLRERGIKTLQANPSVGARELFSREPGHDRRVVEDSGRS